MTCRAPVGRFPNTPTGPDSELEQAQDSREVQALLFADVLVEPQTGPRILTLDQQRWLLSECRRQREWVTATVEMTELAKVILGADLVGYDPRREPPRPEDMIDGGEVWAERLAWLVLQADDPARSVRPQGANPAGLS